MKFSIIIPVKKISDYVREAIPHFQKQTYRDFEIIIISEYKEKEKFPHTKILKSKEAPPAEKRNLGAKLAKGEILAFIDDDAYPKEDWLEKAYKNFRDKDIIAIGGPSIVPKGATLFQEISSKVYELSSKKTGVRYTQKRKQYIDDWPTCNLFVRKKEFNMVRGFDSGSWGAEDTRLCYSLLRNNKKMIYDPNVVVYHHPRKNLSDHLRQTFFWGLWRGFIMKLYRQSLQPVFFIPSIFVLWLIIGGALSLFFLTIRKIYLFSLLLYLLYLFVLGIKVQKLKLFFPVIILTYLTHLAYGIGFLKGMLSIKEPTKKTFNPAENTFTNKIL